jgi:hypothetical protein
VTVGFGVAVIVTITVGFNVIVGVGVLCIFSKIVGDGVGVTEVFGIADLPKKIIPMKRAAKVNIAGI